MKRLFIFFLLLAIVPACSKHTEMVNGPHVLQLEFYIEDLSAGDHITIKSDDGNSTTYHDLKLGRNLVEHTVSGHGQRLWLYDEQGKRIASIYYQ